MSRGRWEEMTSFPGELISAVKQARGDVARKEAATKAKQMQAESESRLREPKAEPKSQETRSEQKTDISIGSTMEKIKARQKMMADL